MLVTLNYALGLVIVGRDGAAGTLLLYFALVPCPPLPLLSLATRASPARQSMRMLQQRARGCGGNHVLARRHCAGGRDVGGRGRRGALLGRKKVFRRGSGRGPVPTRQRPRWPL